MARRRFQTPTLRRSSTKTGKGDRWWFRAYVDVRTGPGQRERIEKSYHIGYVSEMGIREAKSKMADKVAALNSPQEILQSQVRFGEVCDKWLAMFSGKPQTLAGYTSVVEAHIRPRWGDVRMCDLTPLAVEEWILGKSREFAETTVTHIRRRFSQIWKCALRWEYTERANPMALVPKPRNYGGATRLKTLPSIANFHRFLAELKPAYREVVTFCVGTGMRISEVTAVQWKQMGGEFLKIEQARDPRGNVGPVKTKESNRTVPIAHLKIIRPSDVSDTDFVFPVNYDAVQYELKRAAEVVGIHYEGFGTHTFRRMHNTLFRRHADGRVDLAQKQLGHADQEINDLYYVMDETDLKARAEIVERMMGTVMGGVQ